MFLFRRGLGFHRVRKLSAAKPFPGPSSRRDSLGRPTPRRDSLRARRKARSSPPRLRPHCRRRLINGRQRQLGLQPESAARIFAAAARSQRLMQLRCLQRGAVWLTRMTLLSAMRLLTQRLRRSHLARGHTRSTMDGVVGLPAQAWVCGVRAARHHCRTALRPSPHPAAASRPLPGLHASRDCQLCYHKLRGPCPGFLPDDHQDPAAWIGMYPAAWIGIRWRVVW